MQQLSDQEAAERYRLLQAAALLVKFHQERGDAASVEGVLVGEPSLRNPDVLRRLQAEMDRRGLHDQWPEVRSELEKALGLQDPSGG